ncbi:hypothetical protein EIN_085650 [Entamoeba invadens IP1]|uniref:hypothetical protein n=1 Tax=Entamoeba invadens IP1 TaxID=370355 RepID=UPI0002C3FB65|nr:hypothetical protein EIN_085650 [Entamoeba invadens IP1]ELP85323.1 hypothetical protein EIN_085650 [Entamoeba invadens IP1]|eukprot:XP_004184669.1 hypothetical protein EIN_085650 [Entamoeba invadens IP1]
MKSQLSPRIAIEEPVISSFWAFKQGGSVKTTKKRYFVLKANKLFYYESENTSVEPKGCIYLSSTTVLKERTDLHVEKQKYYVSITSHNDKFALFNRNDVHMY